MKSEEAHSLATVVCGAFGASRETVSAYAWAIRGFDLEPMQRAVKATILDRDRIPSLKALLGAYYRERARTQAASATAGAVPCDPCQRQDGWPSFGSGVLNPPRAAMVPYLRGYRATDDNGKPAETVWAHENCCSAHARLAVAEERRRQIEAREVQTYAGRPAGVLNDRPRMPDATAGGADGWSQAPALHISETSHPGEAA